MHVDALARRLRFAPPNPLARRLVLTEADLVAFAAIDRHGPLPTHYLYAYTRHLRKDYSQLQNRLTDLYNGTRLQRPWLIRPRQQFASFCARYQHLVYDLAPPARLALAEQGRVGRWSLERTDPFVHRLMGACVAASIELSAPLNGLRYISREEILAHPKCVASRRAGNPMAIPLPQMGNRLRLIPDDLFGLEYPGQGYRFFALEIDRNTESIESKRVGQSAFGKKVAGYLQLLQSGAYREWWGIPNLHILTVTTNETHGRNIIDYIKRSTDRDLDRRFEFACVLEFGANWRVPRHTLDLLGQARRSLAGTRDIGGNDPSFQLPS